MSEKPDLHDLTRDAAAQLTTQEILTLLAECGLIVVLGADGGWVWVLRIAEQEPRFLGPEQSLESAQAALAAGLDALGDRSIGRYQAEVAALHSLAGRLVKALHTAHRDLYGADHASTDDIFDEAREVLEGNRGAAEYLASFEEWRRRAWSAEQGRDELRAALRAVEQRIAVDAEELAALVCGIRHYARRHRLRIGECVAWNVLKGMLGVGESNEVDNQRWDTYQQRAGTALANYYRPRVK